MIGHRHNVILALSAALLSALAVILLAAPKPLNAAVDFFIGPFSSIYYLGNMLSNASLLLIAGAGVALAFRAGVFNLGGEGQVYSSSLTAALLALALPPSWGFFGTLLILLSSTMTGGLIGGVNGLCKRLWNVDEMIGSFLLGQGLFFITDYLITGPLRSSSGYLLATEEIPKTFFLPRILPPSYLSISILLAPILALLLHRYLFFSRSGYELRMSGLARDFARYGGINTGRYYTLPMLISGGLYGLCGGLLVLSVHHMAIQGGSTGIGWNGIAVALIGANNPLLLIPSALVFAYLQEAAASASLASSISLELGSIVQAVVFLFITVPAFRSLKR